MARTYTTDENRVRLQKLIDERDDLSREFAPKYANASRDDVIWFETAMQKLAWRIAAVRSAITRQT